MPCIFVIQHASTKITWISVVAACNFVRGFVFSMHQTKFNLHILTEFIWLNRFHSQHFIYNFFWVILKFDCPFMNWQMPKVYKCDQLNVRVCVFMHYWFINIVLCFHRHDEQCAILLITNCGFSKMLIRLLWLTVIYIQIDCNRVALKWK